MDSPGLDHSIIILGGCCRVPDDCEVVSDAVIATLKTQGTDTGASVGEN